MPRVFITGQSEKVGADAEKFPSLKLKEGQRARVSCLESQADPATGQLVVAPYREYTHRMEAPKVVDGVAQRVTKKGRDGAETTDWDREWIGSPLCLGDVNTLITANLDPAHCPVCRAHQEEPSYVGGPMPKFAMNVVVYGTRHGSWELSNPPSASVIAWTFPGSRYDKLIDIAHEDAPSGDLRFVDLKLGPCEYPELFQKYPVAAITGTPVWQLSPEWTSYVSQLWMSPGNRATDEQLQALCGRKVTNREWLDRDISKCLQNWRIAMAQQNGQAGSAVPFQQGMGQMAQAAQAFGGAAPLVPPAPGAPAAPVADPVPQAGPPLPQAPQAAPALPTAPPVPQAAPAFPAAPPAAPQVPSVPAPPDPSAALAQHPGGIAEFAPQGVLQVPSVPQAPQAAPALPTAPPVPQAAAPAVPQAAPQAAPVPPAGSVTTDQVPFENLTSF